MMQSLRRSLLGVFAVVVASVASVAPAYADEPPFVARQALVRLRPSASIAAFNARYATTTVDRIPSRPWFLLALPPTPDEQQFVSQFRQDADVVFADVNFVADDTNTGGSTQDIFLASDAGAYLSDGAPSVVGLPLAHTRSLGTGVVVAVVDTGVDPLHPLLAGRLAPGGFDFLTGTATIADPGPGRFRGHGTLVAGLVARSAPEARILPIRVLDTEGKSTVFLVARAMFHALDHGAGVINVSLGTQAENQEILRSAVVEAESRGVLVVAAAGNDDAESPARFPAGFESSGVVSVTATNNSFVRANFSNHGEWISLAAPGVSVVGPVPGGGFGRASGTSFATPYVAGVAALIKARCPGIGNAELRARLLGTSVPINGVNPGYEGKLGAGRLAAEVAMGLPKPALACDCRADFNADGVLIPSDVFGFLSAYFAGSPRGDFDASGKRTPGDVFAFLGVYFTWCP
jgi:subtilisin family serine protease